KSRGSPDRMIRGFVDAALKEQHLAPVKAETARRIVAAVHAAERPDVELQKFDHAIWKSPHRLAC
ncbi:hypothetical protein, partial [Pseudarthrobacter sp. AG30]|uniref:hypothetical protein n=1 Tax=Pseudarthrobacter sp. AG30 TaxID=2249742 RepID=UPI00197F03C9